MIKSFLTEGRMMSQYFSCRSSSFCIVWSSKTKSGSLKTFLMSFKVPLTSPFLLREGLGKDQLVCTLAACMTIMHGAKIVTFVALGFDYGEFGWRIAGMIVGVVLGSWVGTKLRRYASERVFRRTFKLLLTALGLRMLVIALF